MADEAPPEVEQDPVDTEATEPEEPQEGTEAEPTDDGEKFDPDKALEKIRKLNSEAANLRRRLKEAEPKAATADESAARLKALEAENLRLRIGARHGLPDAIIDRLKGDTEEEILADAEKLLDLFSGKRPPTEKPTERLRGGGDPVREPEETDLAKIGERMFRR